MKEPKEEEAGSAETDKEEKGHMGNTLFMNLSKITAKKRGIGMHKPCRKMRRNGKEVMAGYMGRKREDETGLDTLVTNSKPNSLQNMVSNFQGAKNPKLANVKSKAKKQIPGSSTEKQ